MVKLMPPENIIIITNKENFFNVFNQIKDICPEYDKNQILSEPVSLNTAPAVALGVKYLMDCKRANLDEAVIMMPSDQYIGDLETYLNLLETATDNLDGNIGTIGITPSKPETGYGYIKKGEPEGGHYRVVEFKEKPDRATAISYLESGNYLWNSGIYLFKIGAFINELKKCSPDIYRIFVKDYQTFLAEFEKMPSVAIDVAISEKSDNMIVFEGAFQWSDIGSFDSLSEIENGGINSRHISIDSKNVFVHSTNNRLVATLGVQDLIIVENNDSILVQKKGASEEVRKIVDYLKQNKIKELSHNLIVYRPWGKYEVLIDEPKHKVKKITVYPGAKLSLQAHHHRAEHWIVIKGMAEIVNGEKTIHLCENQSTFIPSFTKHRLANPGKISLELIEVQTGEYLEEDDIIRYEDVYNRIDNSKQ